MQSWGYQKTLQVHRVWTDRMVSVGSYAAAPPELPADLQTALLPLMEVAQHYEGIQQAAARGRY